ncbi:MAG: UDP-N-acetylmuramate dehydrogenase [Candidatus Omnitrophica bacterium]|nr:UDP-N-acetylmuramate dehydrogenase [Candidatus Omnitrophota bacterium]
MSWWRDLKATVIRDEPLKNKTNFKIGGKARFFFSVKNEEELRELVVISSKHKIPLFVLGAGSNILVSDVGIKGIVVKLGSGIFKEISFSKNNSVEAGAGVRLAELIGKTSAVGLSGLEFLAGIPGTLGGAIIMNAGAWGKDIGSIVESVRVMDNRGNIELLKRKKIKFSYRHSGLDSYIILGAVLKLASDTKDRINQRIKEYLKLRSNTQDNAYPNAGCIFKNPAGTSAGKLIDACGLKAKSCGGAVVSSRHANFILNKKNASSKDVLKLMNLIRDKVKSRFNITLEPEIKIWM